MEQNLQLGNKVQKENWTNGWRMNVYAKRTNGDSRKWGWHSSNGGIQWRLYCKEKAAKEKGQDTMVSSANAFIIVFRFVISQHWYTSLWWCYAELWTLNIEHTEYIKHRQHNHWVLLFRERHDAEHWALTFQPDV